MSVQADIIRLDTDGLVAALRGRRGGTWAHWQLALSYARYLSPEFHLWCNTVVRAAMEWRGGPPAAEHDPLLPAPRPAVPRPAPPARHPRAARGGPDVPGPLGPGPAARTGGGTSPSAARPTSPRWRPPSPSVASAPAAAAGASSPRAAGRAARRRVRPLLPSRPEQAGAWLADLPAMPCRADLWRLPRPLPAHARVPRLPGRGARAPAPGVDRPQRPSEVAPHPPSPRRARREPHDLPTRSWGFSRFGVVPAYAQAVSGAGWNRAGSRPAPRAAHRCDGAARSSSALGRSLPSQSGPMLWKVRARSAPLRASWLTAYDSPLHAEIEAFPRAGPAGGLHGHRAGEALLLRSCTRGFAPRGPHPGAGSRARGNGCGPTPHFVRTCGPGPAPASAP